MNNTSLTLTNMTYGVHTLTLTAIRSTPSTASGSDEEKFTISALMMDASSISETSVNFHHTRWRNFPDDRRLHTHRREGLKPQQAARRCDVLYVCSSNLQEAFLTVI